MLERYSKTQIDWQRVSLLCIYTIIRYRYIINSLDTTADTFCSANTLVSDKISYMNKNPRGLPAVSECFDARGFDCMLIAFLRS